MKPIIKLNKLAVFLIAIVALSVSINIFQAVSAATSAPGSSGDPIVSKSYVDAGDKKSSSSISALQSSLNAAKKDITSLKSQVAALKKGYVSITVDAGKKITATNGTEIIVRTGKATGLSGTDGGLFDVTSGKDLTQGTTAAVNHLFVSSKTDGRGLTCATKCTLIVRGSYKI